MRAIIKIIHQFEVILAFSLINWKVKWRNKNVILISSEGGYKIYSFILKFYLTTKYSFVVFLGGIRGINISSLS